MARASSIDRVSAASSAGLPVPERTAEAFATALLGRDPTAAAAYFGPEGRFLTADGTELVGRPAIREVIAQLAGSAVDLQIRVGRTVLAGDVALHTQYWRRTSPPRSTGAGPKGFESLTTATLVLRRRGERWEILIAAPWG